MGAVEGSAQLCVWGVGGLQGHKGTPADTPSQPLFKAGCPGPAGKQIVQTESPADRPWCKQHCPPSYYCSTLVLQPWSYPISPIMQRRGFAQHPTSVLLPLAAASLTSTRSTARQVTHPSFGPFAQENIKSTDPGFFNIHRKNPKAHPSVRKPVKVHTSVDP